MPGPWLATILPRLSIPPEKLDMVTTASPDGAVAGRDSIGVWSKDA